jgi:hypothetical protein
VGGVMIHIGHSYARAVKTAAIAALTLTLAGCAAKAPAKVAAPSPSPSPSPSPVTPGDLTLGQVFTWPDKHGRVTVHAYQQPTAKDSPPPDQAGTEWGGLDVEVCVDALSPEGKPISVSQDPWALFLANNGLLESSSSRYGSFPVPAYPMGGKEVPVGRCVRGWIVFVVPIGQRPVRAEYAPSGINPVSWSLAG